MDGFNRQSCLTGSGNQSEQCMEYCSPIVNIFDQKVALYGEIAHSRLNKQYQGIHQKETGQAYQLSRRLQCHSK